MATVDEPAESELSHVSGRGVVIAMFLFGIVLTGLMWTYWKFHTGPFRPLQDAIAAEIPGSSPRVDGGQRKMHRGGPRILRVTIRVKYDPTRPDAPNAETVDRLITVARRHIDLQQYDQFQAYLFHGVPEQEVRQTLVERDLSEFHR